MIQEGIHLTGLFAGNAPSGVARFEVAPFEVRPFEFGPSEAAPVEVTTSEVTTSEVTAFASFEIVPSAPWVGSKPPADVFARVESECEMKSGYPHAEHR